MSVALPVKENEKYLKLISCCFARFRKHLKILNYTHESNVLRLTVEVLSCGEVEFIRLRNTSFFSYPELIDKLSLKLENICSKY